MKPTPVTRAVLNRLRRQAQKRVLANPRDAEARLQLAEAFSLLCREEDALEELTIARRLRALSPCGPIPLEARVARPIAHGEARSEGNAVTAVARPRRADTDAGAQQVQEVDDSDILSATDLRRSPLHRPPASPYTP